MPWQSALVSNNISGSDHYKNLLPVPRHDNTVAASHHNGSFVCLCGRLCMRFDGCVFACASRLCCYLLCSVVQRLDVPPGCSGDRRWRSYLRVS